MKSRKAEIRSSQLLEMLQLNRRLDVGMVSESMGISEATVRRLFARLDKEGKVIRTHGGVRLAAHLGPYYSYFLSAAHRNAEKTMIGKAASEIVESGERLYLDSGTTVLKCAEHLGLKLQSGALKAIVVLTNSLVLVDVLARWCKVILIGGEVRTERRDVCGPISEDTLSVCRVNRAFLGADAVHPQSGFMTTDERTAKLNEIILRNTSHSYVLADSEKFSLDSFISYATLNQVEKVYTDESLGDEALKGFQGAGASIELVHASPRHKTAAR